MGGRGCFASDRRHVRLLTHPTAGRLGSPGWAEKQTIQRKRFATVVVCSVFAGVAMGQPFPRGRVIVQEDSDC